MDDHDKRKRAEKLLADKGVKIVVGGCGCCGSPWVSLEIDGEHFYTLEDATHLDNKALFPEQEVKS